MKIIVIGMGEVGQHIASVLVGEGHDITIIDISERNLRRAEEIMDVLALRGHGASLRTLREAKVSSADLLIAVTNQDETNILAAMTAKQLGTKEVVARTSGREYLDTGEGTHRNLLGIDLVISEQVLTAIEVHRLVKTFGAIAVEVFMENRVEMIELPVHDEAAIAGKPVHDLDLPDHCVVAGILRNDGLIFPGGMDTLLPGDQVFLFGPTERIPRIEKLFERSREQRVRKVVIVGGGEVGFSVARMLESEGVGARLIERDQDRCFELSHLLDRTSIINGDGTNLSLLGEEMERCDVFVAVSGDDDTNLMSCLLARQLKAKKTICLVARPDYASIYEALGIDATVSPRLSASNRILKYARQGEVLSVRVLDKGKAEILEIVPSAGSAIVDKPFRDVNFPRNALIVAVAGEGGPFLPKGKEVLKAGNVAVVFTDPKVRPSVERLFRKKLLSFG